MRPRGGLEALAYWRVAGDGHGADRQGSRHTLDLVIHHRLRHSNRPERFGLRRSDAIRLNAPVLRAVVKRKSVVERSADQASHGARNRDRCRRDLLNAAPLSLSLHGGGDLSRIESNEHLFPNVERRNPASRIDGSHLAGIRRGRLDISLLECDSLRLHPRFGALADGTPRGCVDDDVDVWRLRLRARSWGREPGRSVV